MSELTFYIDIENSTGTRYGSGPITSAARWIYTARMDKAGEFSFSLPATDTQASIVQRKRVVRAWALVGGVWTDVGAGIIDNIVRRPQADGTVWLEVSGSDLLRELTYRSVKDLKLTDSSSYIPHFTALTSIATYAPSGWTFTADTAPPNDYVYGRFNGETVLTALIKTADSSMTHFYRGTGRNVTFAHTFTNSGIRAIQAGPGDLVAETCAITGLTETYDSYDLITRIYPRGSGNGDVQLTLRATSRSAPSGFTLNTADNYIENDTAEATYGIIEQFVEYREIGPIANTAADLQAAANMLFDVALDELQRRSTDAEQAYYDLALAGCSTLLRPMQTLRVVYQDVDAAISIDQDLNILETTWQVDQSGVQTTAVIVSTTDRWAQTDASTIADSIAQGYVYQAHPQLNANSYTTGYTKNVDANYNAEFRFRLGSEVVQVQQVLMEFQLLPFESTVRAVGGATSGSGDLATNGPSVNTTGSNNDSTGAASGDTGAASGNTGTPSVTDTGAASGDTGAASGNTGAASGNTGGSGELTTGAPEGGDIVSDGQHRHFINIEGGTFEGDWYTLYWDESRNSIRAGGWGDDESVLVSLDGDHTHDITTHTHSLNSHTHSLNSHTHSLNSHAHSLNNHTHSLNSHTHSLNSHTHSLNSHTHSLNNHTHDLSESITAIYGIFRETSTNTYEVAHLQYRINSGTWTNLATDAVDAGDDWWQLDITDAVINADTFRPLQTANTIEMRVIPEAVVSVSVGPLGTLLIQGTGIGDIYVTRDVLTVTGTTNYNGDHEITGRVNADTVVTSTSSDDFGSQSGAIVLNKTVTVDALLSVRNVIQAIAYT